MADEKLNTGPAENISPEAAEPITTPEQAAASEPQQEQTGPAIPESGDVVVSFDKINELSHIRKNNQADGAGTGVCAGHGGSEDPQGIPWAASTTWQTKCAKAHGPRHSHKQH